MTDRGSSSNHLAAAIIVNWNHKTFLPACLEALRQDGSFDIVVIDNDSTDGSPEWLAQHHPDIRLIRFSANQGFARALNHGINHTNHAFVLSLNPDVVIRPGFGRELVSGLQKTERATGLHIGMAAPKMLRANDPHLLDSTGLLIDRRRRPYDRGQGERDHSQYDAQTDVFGPCGAAAFYRREMLEDIATHSDAGDEFLDAGFFAYCEDADLAWRAQLRGWHCAYVPTAVATHVRGWGDTLRKRGHARKNDQGPRLALRNRYLMTIQNDAWRYIAADLPLMLVAELPRLAYAAFTAPKVLLALSDLIRAWPSALHKRRAIRSRRTVDDASLRHWFTASRAPITDSSASRVNL